MKSYLFIPLFLLSILDLKAQEIPTEQDSSKKHVEVMPVFEGGEAAMYKFLNENSKYPREAMNDCAQGKVYVQFIVSETGSIDSVVIFKGVHPLIDLEAIRIIELMNGKWTPGTQDGKAVKVMYKLPISFTLNSYRCNSAIKAYQFGVKHFEDENYGKALKAFAKAIKIAPHYRKAIHNSALIHIKMNNFEDACHDLRKIQAGWSHEVNDLIEKYCNN